MSKTASWHNGYCESGFAGKRVHADAIDCWRIAIDDAGACRTGCWQMLTRLAKSSISAVHADLAVTTSCLTACRAG